MKGQADSRRLGCRLLGQSQRPFGPAVLTYSLNPYGLNNLQSKHLNKGG